MRLRFLLDTDTVSYALRGQPLVTQHLRQHAAETVAVSSISLAELRYGIELRHSARLKTGLADFLSQISILPFDDAAATAYGVVGARLSKAGTPIGQFDTLLAAHAVAAGLVLVTNNTRHFSKVPGLVIENWAKDKTN